MNAAGSDVQRSEVDVCNCEWRKDRAHDPPLRRLRQSGARRRSVRDWSAGQDNLSGIEIFYPSYPHNLTAFTAMSLAATVFFGLTVRASDLIAAALAFPSIEPTLRAISLIQLRRQRATLAFHPSTRPVLMEVPPEVWDAIKSRLITLAVKVSRADMQREARCLSCEELAIYGRVLDHRERQKLQNRRTSAWTGNQEIQEENRIAFERRRKTYSGKRLWAGDWIDHSERPREACHSHWLAKSDKWLELVQHQLDKGVSHSISRSAPRSHSSCRSGVVPRLSKTCCRSGDSASVCHT